MGFETISDELLQQAAFHAKSAVTPKAPYDIQAEAAGNVHLTDEQKRLYKDISTAYERTATQTGGNHPHPKDPDYMHLKTELAYLNGQPDDVKDAVVAKLLLDSARDAQNGKSANLTVDLLAYVPSTRDMKFKDSHGKGVSFEGIIAEGIEVPGDPNKSKRLFPDSDAQKGWNHMITQANQVRRDNDLPALGAGREQASHGKQ